MPPISSFSFLTAGGPSGAQHSSNINLSPPGSPHQQYCCPPPLSHLPPPPCHMRGGLIWSSPSSVGFVSSPNHISKIIIFACVPTKLKENFLPPQLYHEFNTYKTDIKRKSNMADLSQHTRSPDTHWYGGMKTFFKAQVLVTCSYMYCM